jgi:hypothetical protein
MRKETAVYLLEDIDDMIIGRAQGGTKCRNRGTECENGNYRQ